MATYQTVFGRRKESVERNGAWVSLETAIHYEGAQSVAAFRNPTWLRPRLRSSSPKTYWQTIREICDRYDVLLITDEVVTGFGRTGEWFAMDHYDIVPDIMALAKGIASSYIPFGAVAVSAEINAPFSRVKHTLFMALQMVVIHWVAPLVAVDRHYSRRKSARELQKTKRSAFLIQRRFCLRNGSRC